MPEIKYLQQEQTLYNSRQQNLKTENSTEMSWAVTSFNGMTSTLPQTATAAYASLALNVVPELTHFSKAPGAEAVGRFVDINPFSGFVNLFCGKLDVRRQGEKLWTIIYDEQEKRCSFYLASIKALEDPTEIWQRKNPVDKDNKEYYLKGIDFDIVQYKNLLFLCSGKENFTDKNGNTSGLLMLDLETQEWQAILTGKAAPLDLGENAKTVEAAGKNPDTFYSSLDDFNPSILEVYKDRLLISGSEANPFQVKCSEHLNPKNFVEGVLGYTVQPLTAEDNRRASTFFVNEAVTSLTLFGDNVYVGTKNKFYIYTLTLAGETFEVDRITPDFSSTSGPVNNKSVKVAKGAMYFASNYQVLPELNRRLLEYKTALSGKSYTVAAPPEKISYLLEESLKNYNIRNSAVGVYKNSILWAVQSCEAQASEDLKRDTEGEPIDRLIRNDRVILYSQTGESQMLYIWNHINANYFAEIDNRGLIYSSSISGLVYRINESINYVDNHEGQVSEDFLPSPIDYPSVYQTGLVGVAKGDTAFSRKKMTKLFLTGGFSDNTVIKVSVFGVGSQCGEDVCCQAPLFEKIFELQDKCGNGGNNCTVLPDLNYYKGVKYFKKVIPIPSSGDDIRLYNELYVQILIGRSSYFYVSSIGGSYTLQQNLDDNLLMCAKSVENINMDWLDENQEPVVYYDCEVCDI